MNYSELIELVNKNPFNGISISINEITNGELKKSKESVSVTFVAEISLKEQNISFKKKYVMLDNNEDFNSFLVIMRDKFNKDFVESYFTKGILYGDKKM